MLDKLDQFSFNHSDQIDRLYEVMTTTQMKQLFDSRGEELRIKLNKLVDDLQAEVGASNIGMTPIAQLGTQNKVKDIINRIVEILKSTANGSSGADFISATSIAGLEGVTVQALLESLKKFIDDYKNELNSNNGASKVKTTSGKTVQEEINRVEGLANSSVTTSNEAKDIANTANNRVNNIVSNTPTNKDAELVDMRFDALNNKTYVTAGKRIDDITLQLAEKANQIDMGIANRKINSAPKINRLIPINTPFLRLSDYEYYPIKTVGGIQTWTLTNGILIPNCTDALTSAGTIMLCRNKSISDGEISVNLKQISIGANIYAGIAFRVKDENNYLDLMFKGADNSLMLSKHSNGSSTLLKAQTISTSINNNVSSAGEIINLKVQFVGDQIKVWYNGTLYMILTSKDVNGEVIATDESNGYFGLASISADNTVVNNVEFSNFNVKEKRFDMLPSKLDSMSNFGDSVTYGANATPLLENAWVYRLAKKLKEDNSNFIHGIKGVADNHGVGGFNTNEIKGAMFDWIGEGNTPYKMPDGVTYYTREKPTFVTIMGGINDSRIDSVGISIETSVQNFRAMIRYLKRFGIIPIVCTTTQIDKNSTNGINDVSSWIYLQQLVNRIKIVCAQEKVIVANTYECLNNDLINNIDSSQIHPTNEGHRLIFEEVYNTIMQY